MKKFFLFRREEINEASVHSSDTGEGLSVFAVPSDNVAHITAVKGFVNITFNGSGLYDNVSLLTGDKIEKTSVSIACAPNEEMTVIELILNFISAETRESVMKFDVVDQASTFSRSKTESKNDITVSLKSNPTSILSGEETAEEQARLYNNVIGGIAFNKNKPVIDYNHEEFLTTGTSVITSTGWKNSGSGGSTYDISSAVGVVKSLHSLNVLSAFSTSYVTFPSTAYFIIPNSFKVKKDYTIYVVCSTKETTTTSTSYKSIFGDEDGETSGFAGTFSTISFPKQIATKDFFTMRHSGVTGLPAKSTTKENDWTVSFSYPDLQPTASNYNGCDVFIIRRDKDFNLFLHNRNGDIISFIPAKTRLNTPDSSSSTSGLTDGDLLLEQIGAVAQVPAATADIKIARFGVLDYDIGLNASTKLAKNLFNLYTL